MAMRMLLVLYFLLFDFLTFRYRKYLGYDYQSVTGFQLQNSNKKEYKHYFIENQDVNNFFWRIFFRK